jgi:phosphoglycerate dehydrogenase-like enzyme
MRIGIIGAGAIGQTVATLARDAGFDPVDLGATAESAWVGFTRRAGQPR